MSFFHWSSIKNQRHGVASDRRAQAPRHMKEQFLGSDNLFVQSLAKGIGLLEALGARPGALSLTDLADPTGMDRAAAKRMPHTRVKLGYMETGAIARGFVRGRKTLDPAFDYLSHNLLI